MNQVSTNLTLLYRIFIPVFFGVLLGALMLFTWLHPSSYSTGVRGNYFRWGLTAFYAAMIAVFAFTVWRLRRVEMSRDWVYVTDYFRQARYPWTNIQSVHETPLGLFTLVRLRFFEPGSFGEWAIFIASGSRWRIFKEEFPERLAERLR